VFPHDILDFCERELVTLGGGEIEKKMAIIVLVKPRWNHHNISDWTKRLRVNRDALRRS
jgi:hypothetical protein